MIAGPAPAPLARAESFYRYQIMLRTRQMTCLSRELARLMERLELPEDGIERGSESGVDGLQQSDLEEDTF